MSKITLLLKKYNQSKILFFVILVMIFVLFFILNTLTPYQFDDFAYMYSFETGERITSVGQIVGSMRVHKEVMGGRIVAHTLVSLILMLPKWCFNILNSLAYVGLGCLIYYICNGKHERNNLFLGALFSAIWIFEPGFGDVNLWLDGSVNYLWGHIICLCFFIPFLNRFFDDKRLSIPGRIIFCVGAFFVGAYSENSSFAVVSVAILICILTVIVKKQKIEWYYCVAIVIAISGYLFLVTSTGTNSKYGVELKASAILNQFALAMMKYRDCIWLVIVFVVFVCINIARENYQALAKSGLFFLLSLVSNFILLAASYYPDRSAAMPILMLITSTGILVVSAWKSDKERLGVVSLLVVAIVVGMFEFVVGAKDIYGVNEQIEDNKAIIYEKKEQGILDIVLPQVTCDTKYSPEYKSQYLNTTQPAEYPNEFLARYYELNSLLGE